MSNLGIARLQVQQRQTKSVVATQYSQAPLQLHRPLYETPESPPVVYLKTPSSGLLAGDEHRIEIDVEADAGLELRTQAATLVYPGQSKQSFRAHIGRGGSLVFRPHVIILAAEAELVQTVEIKLKAGASLIYQEDWSAGRIAMGECWQFKSYNYFLRVWIEDRLIYRERWCLQPALQPLSSQLICGPYTHFRTALFLGGNAPQPQSVEQQINNHSRTWQMATANGVVRRWVSHG